MTEQSIQEIRNVKATRKGEDQADKIRREFDDWWMSEEANVFRERLADAFVSRDLFDVTCASKLLGKACWTAGAIAGSKIS